MKQEKMMPEVVLQDIKKPCDDCSIAAMQATLINSSSQLPLAPDTGIHLHHIIFFNEGVADLVCPEMGERFFGSGDARWTLRWNSHGDYGYKVKAQHRWDTVIEMMNDGKWEGEVEIKVLFEIDTGTSEVRPVWLDATGCGRSDVDVKSTIEPFKYTTPEWISSVSGILLDIAAHQHDGGIDMTGYLNGDQLCRSTQLYSSQTTEQHISAVGVCKNIGRIRPGDRLWSEARYDPVLHHLTIHHRHPDPVMASMGIYIGIE
ncbi:MAG: hypothetical protein Q9194_002642 [Teloschistes cf. exilis]